WRRRKTGRVHYGHPEDAAGLLLRIARAPQPSKASTACRATVSLLPSVEEVLDLGRRFIEIRGHRELALEWAQRALRECGLWHETSHGLSRLGNDDLLPPRDSLQQFGEVCFRFMNVDGFHGRILVQACGLSKAVFDIRLTRQIV